MFLNRLTHECLNLIITPLVLALIPLILPLLLIFRLMFSIFGRFFCENMAGKVVLITGASSGIGEHMAYEYAKKRANLVIVARRKELLLEVAERARQLGSPDVLVACADVSSVEDCRQFVEDAINHFGRRNNHFRDGSQAKLRDKHGLSRILNKHGLPQPSLQATQVDHLVNNAGVACLGKFEDVIDVANFKSLMDVNLWGSIYPTFFAIPHLKRTKGKIFVSSSTAALLHPPALTFYTASKAALLGFFEALRLELAPRVTITIGTFGIIESEMTTQGKLFSKDREISVDPENIQALPIMKVGSAAKAIVNAICRGERYLTQPSWNRVLHLLKFLCPEVGEWCFNIMYKKMPDMNGEPRTCHVSVLPADAKGSIFS